ncbi:MAG: hypothetical protein ABI778_06445 [Ignavibacteriota bacterium]
MNNLPTTRRMMLSLIALVVILFASKSFAAVNMYLEITDNDGKITKVTVSKDGSFTSPTLKKGVYSFSWGVSGAASSVVVDGRGSTPEDQAKHANKIESIAISHDIISPRDPASGLPTGKRMHKPFTLTLSLSERLLPTVNKKLGSITIDVDGSTLTGNVEMKDHSGKVMAMDDWHAQ